MKRDKTLEPDESLRKVLREWEVDAPLPSHFQAGVWEGIERAEARSAVSTPWRSVMASLLNPFSRPGFALAYVAVLLTLGVAAGSRAAQIKTSQLGSDLKMRYIQSIAPFGREMPNP